MRIAAVTYIVLGSGTVALAFIYLKDMRLLYIETFAGMALLISGLAVGIMGVSSKNTRLILQSIMLLSDGSGSANLRPEQEIDNKPGRESDPASSR
jgi:uncharacterized membrane protein YjjP (DUF1212 family)